MRGPFVAINCPHCDEATQVAIPSDARLVDVLKDPPDADAADRARTVIEKTRRKRCPNAHEYGIYFIRRLPYWQVE